MYYIAHSSRALCHFTNTQVSHRLPCIMEHCIAAVVIKTMDGVYLSIAHRSGDRFFLVNFALNSKNDFSVFSRAHLSLSAQQELMLLIRALA